MTSHQISIDEIILTLPPSKEDLNDKFQTVNLEGTTICPLCYNLVKKINQNRKFFSHDAFSPRL